MSIKMNDDLKMKSVQPWEHITWSPEVIKNMYREWGTYFSNAQKHRQALKFYNMAHQMDNKDCKTLFQRNQCKRYSSTLHTNFKENLLKAKKSFSHIEVDLEIAASLYDSNKLEATIVELSNDFSNYEGFQKLRFLNRIDILKENFNDSLGDSLGPFILKNEKIFPVVIEEERLKNFVDNRPYWKIQIEQQKCDILSIPEIELIELSPLELARRERSFRIMNQIYFNRTWKDIDFLRNLSVNPNYLLPQAKRSLPTLKDNLCNIIESNKRFLKILQVRSPLYNENSRRYLDSKLREKHRQQYLYYVQYQTRRNMINILRNVQKLRKIGCIDTLSNYIENAMGQIVVLKTYRTLPWKFEFINDVYNTLALAYLDSFVIPPNINKIKSENRVQLLLKLPKVNIRESQTVIFGVKETFHLAEMNNNSANRQKEFMEHMKKRIKFSKYQIEITYLLHQIAKSHFEQNNFRRSVTIAKKAITEADKCNSNIWKFLNTMLIAKCYAIENKIEYLNETLIDAKFIADKLKSKYLVNFVNLCHNINNSQLVLRKERQSRESIRGKRKSRMNSNYSFSSYTSLRSSEGTPL